MLKTILTTSMFFYQPLCFYAPTQDLEAWVTGAGSAGVVYFSMGSTVSGASMPSQYRQIFLEAFRRLPQRILWKYEGELEDKPDNVRVSRWLPQQDLLGKWTGSP